MTSRDQLVGELDLHLFAEGTHRRLWELLGPQGAVSGVRFSVWAPNASAVAIVGDWNDWQPEALERVDVKGPTGIWSVVSNRAGSGDCYKFEITTSEGRTIRKADPMARRTERPPSDASVVPAFDEFEWSDDEWMDGRGSTIRGTTPLRVYEVHLGSWRRTVDDWDALAEQVGEHVERLGFTHVELLPVAEHPFGGSWGYQVSGYYAPTARFGEPDGCRRFVDSLHGRGIGVILDWVPAHFPKDDWSLGRFDGTPLYEHPDPQRGEHPDWGTYVFDFGRNEVRNFLVANALYWLDEFHIDGLRVDAVASMLYLDYSRGPGQWTTNEHGGREHLEAIRLLQETNTVVGEEFPDVLMIAEESTAWPKVTRPVSEGGLGFSHKWNLGWMHDTLGYLEHDPVHRRHHHHELTFAQIYAYNERFVLPLSHDEVVHGKGSLLAKIGGDDWQKFAGLRALLAWQWSLPGAPLLFMGGELAPWQEWNDASELPWHLLDHPSHRGVHDLIVEINRRSDSFPALWRRDTDPAGFQWLDAEDSEHSMFSFLRWDDHGAAAMACVANFTPVPRPGYRVGLPWNGEWDVAIDTDAAVWWGSGYRSLDRIVATSDEPWQGQPSSALLDIGPMSMVWLASPLRP
ncbi:1,4-alpha-glucan branching protein GlgB [Ilumatobacter nonamiensis]|uniref:1,4-alpha-glucan branching protein GlgB n=1 Tax=Ilumatobacter nonamiensis TaxID=467093 RepID=UPI000344DCFB|nr:1,4-alpha-glucan branching protein GlgB [Ilumatobacter nonamiensis]